MTAAAVLAERLEREELIGLHLSYPDVDVAYWYNVIAYFDEFLYAPTPVVS